MENNDESEYSEKIVLDRYEKIKVFSQKIIRSLKKGEIKIIDKVNYIDFRI